jgi:hypothetical protein
VKVIVKYDPYGRMGNRLFQYAFGLILSKLKNAELYHDDIPNFKVNSKPCNFYSANVFTTKSFGNQNVDLDYLVNYDGDIIVNSFVQKAKYYTPHRQLLVNELLPNNYMTGSDSIVVHIRETDYIAINGFLGYDYYKKLINDSGFTNITINSISSASGGANVGLTAGVSETGHTLRRVGQGYITLSNAPFQVNDSFTYAAAAGNTSLTGLTSGTSYFISTVNTSAISLSTTPGGAAVVLTPGVSETGHSITGVTATGVAVVGGAKNKGVAHTGWVVRTEGTGGRAGRVQYEVLVAGGIVTDNNNDDATLPDA